MQAVKIKLYQNMVNYRRELSYGYVQTYPLPTPSMVRGMAHSLLQAKQYYPLQISIQGKYMSVVTNMQKIYKFDRKDRYPIPVAVRSSEYNQSVNRGLMYVDQIVDMDLILHIAFYDEELNKKFLKTVFENIVILGRNEDIARVDECKIVNINEPDNRNEQILDKNMFISQSICKANRLEGTAYRLPFKYNDVQSFTDKRIFSFADAKYISIGRELSKKKLPVDDDNCPVAFLKVDDD